MTPDAAAEGMKIAIGLLGCWTLLFVLLRDYRVDSLRQRLFDLRADVFDYAADGHIAFNDPAYLELRARINTAIRFAHRFTAMQLLFVIVLSESVQASAVGRNDVAEFLDQVKDKAVRSKMRSFHTRVAVSIVRHLVTGSPILLAVLAATAARELLQGATRSAMVAMSEWWGISRLEAQARHAHCQ